ncbi:hypothetical protein [Pseudanabaena sp. 'Roaring Creek']|uniref:hypothetical protein n=1 Tax=Pseudanabaena sp. 'Roaring Creek' TaxID=1681830 RepID=UPI0006D86211|nr:hypothetical protein [Pseudanabaena sp. 'Roaring Creek']
MQDKIIAVTEERALMLARLALTQNKILIIEDSLNAIYRERKLGIGEQNRGWVVCAKLDLDGHWDPNLVFVSVSDPDEEVEILPIL